MIIVTRHSWEVEKRVKLRFLARKKEKGGVLEFVDGQLRGSI
jgi:hypothetical protein